MRHHPKRTKRAQERRRANLRQGSRRATKTAQKPNLGVLGANLNKGLTRDERLLLLIRLNALADAMAVNTAVLNSLVREIRR